jgi:hypothetical protein
MCGDFTQLIGSHLGVVLARTPSAASSPWSNADLEEEVNDRWPLFAREPGSRAGTRSIQAIPGTRLGTRTRWRRGVIGAGLFRSRGTVTPGFDAARS